MADIELITDGIAREIIEANKENNEKLINTLHDIDKTTILLTGKHTYNQDRKRYSIPYASAGGTAEVDYEYSLEGRGVILFGEIQLERNGASFSGDLGVYIDNQRVIGEGRTYSDWLPFEKNCKIICKGELKNSSSSYINSYLENISHIVLY